MKAKCDELEKIILDQKKTLEEICSDKEEEMNAGIKEAENKIENLHTFADNLSAENLKFKEIISKLTDETAKLRLELSNSKKSLKLKEKDIDKLSKSFENSKETIKKIKDEKSKLKAEKIEIEKKLESKKVKHKSTETQTSHIESKITPKSSSQMASTSTVTGPLVTTVSNSCQSQTSSSCSSTTSYTNKLENSFNEFDVRDIDETKPADSERPEKIQFDKCERKCIDLKDLKYHNELWHGKSLAEKMLESMKPKTTFYSPPVPSLLNLKAVDKYAEIFGSHKCENCEAVEAIDSETQKPLNFTVCMNNFLEMSDIYRYVNKPT